MATLVPPPSKRQRVEASERSRQQQDVASVPENLGSVRVQFVDQSNGNATGPAVSIPIADASVKNLETLLNTLQGNDINERVPYRFSFQGKPKTSADDQSSDIIDVVRSLYDTVYKNDLKSTEEVLSLNYTPQAVFRVKAVSRCSASISGHGEAILAVSFSPINSSTMVTGSGDSTARIWDCDTGTPLHTLKGHTSWVLAVSYSPDGSLIATGSMDNTVRLWNAKTGESLGGPMKGHSKWITSLAWEPHHSQEPGKPRLASSSKDATVRIWDVVLRRIETVLTGHKGSITCVRWGGIDRIYTSSQDKTIKIWDSKKATLIQTLSSHAHWVNHLALSTDFVLRTSFYDPHETSKPPQTPEERQTKSYQRFQKAATVSNKIIERLVSASDDFTMYLWEPELSSKPVARLLGHQKQVNYVTFSPDGMYIASAGFDNCVKLWNARDGKFLHTLRGHVAPVYQCSFSADSRLLVSSSKDTTLKVWDVRTGKLSMDLPGHKDEVFAVDWSPDGLRVGSGGKDKAVRIWTN